MESRSTPSIMLLVGALAGAVASTPPLTPVVASQTADVELARAFVAAWNAHDEAAVHACFASDVVIEERGITVSASEGDEASRRFDPDDVYGLAAGLAGEAAQMWVLDDDAGTGVVWARGATKVDAWVQALFARDHHADATGYRSSGSAVSWDYSVRADPYQRAPRVPLSRGTVTMEVRDGKITALILEADAASVAARDAAWFAVPTGAAESGARHDGQIPSPTNTQDRRRPSPAWWGMAAVSALVGAVGLSIAARPARGP